MTTSSRYLTGNLFTCFAFLIALSGCLGTRFLKEDQKLLYKQKVDGVNRIQRQDLENLYQQEPNRKFPFIPWAPYVWLYQIGVNSYDTAKYEKKRRKVQNKYEKKVEGKNPTSKYVSRQRLKRNKKVTRITRNVKEGNLLMRWGEPVAVYHEGLTEETSDQFVRYLNSKGYFDAQVTNSTQSIGKWVTSNYSIELGQPFIIDSIYYTVKDTGIMQLIKKTTENQIVIKGENYDQELLSDERERIFNLIVNSGYYDFSRQYITFEVDTTTLDGRKVIVNPIVEDKGGGIQHEVYFVDSVNFVTDANISLPRDLRKSKKYNGVNYRFFEDRYNRRILDWRLYIHEDSMFRRDNTLNTQRQLANLDMFKFININYDTTGSKFVANIFVSPLEKYQTSGEVGVNVSQGLPGPFVNGSFKNRNLFGGLEIFELSGRFGVEGVASASSDKEIYQSTEISTNASLTFPQFLFPMGKKWEARVRNYEPKTTLLTGATFTNRPEYLRNTLLGSITYSWINKRRKLYNFSPAEISLIYSNIDESSSFDEFLEALEGQGNLLRNTFDPSFVSNQSFSVVNNFNYGNQVEKSSYLRYAVESGGTFLNFVDEEKLISEELEYYKYLKFNIDFRRHNPINNNSTVAYRFNFGVAVPYGNNKILPYEKYFFAGGSNGIRAWRPRRLGPGSYTPLDSDGNFTDDFEQQGELLLEASLELRHDILGFIDGALFLDMGNIWTLRDDQSRPNAHLEGDRFFREIAVGTGYGLRLDFSFLLLRFDAGLKIYDPARAMGNRFLWNKDFKSDMFQASENLIFNIGIGYPF